MGRRRPGRRHRPSGEPDRRPPFGAPRQHWWGSESAEEWWLGEAARDRLLEDPAWDRLLEDPARDRLLEDHARTRLLEDPARTRLLEDPARVRLVKDPARDRLLDPAARHRQRWPDPATWHRWLDAATRHPWYTALGVGATFMVLASGVIFISPMQSPSAMTTRCGLVRCAIPHQSPASPVTAPMAGSGTAYRLNSAEPRVNPSPTAATTSGGTMPAALVPSPDPSATASAAPQIPATITVTYALIVRWDGGMLGEFTVANNGSANITGWELSAAFPGDQIQVTWGPTDPDPGSDTLLMEAPSDWPAITPGTSQSGYFIAHGDTTFPSDCTFNGYACSD